MFKNGYPFLTVDQIKNLHEKELKDAMKDLIYEDYAYMNPVIAKIQRKAKELGIEI